MTYTDEAIEKAAKRMFWATHNIMHDHEKHWRKADQTFWLDTTRRALTEADAAMEAAGWVRVPTKETETMRAAGDEAIIDNLDEEKITGPTPAEAAYSAMIAARPTTEKG